MKKNDLAPYATVWRLRTNGFGILFNRTVPAAQRPLRRLYNKQAYHPVRSLVFFGGCYENYRIP